MGRWWRRGPQPSCSPAPGATIRARSWPPPSIWRWWARAWSRSSNVAMARSANAVHGPIADAPAESVISHRQVLGVVDAPHVLTRAGAAAEHEDIVPV